MDSITTSPNQHIQSSRKIHAIALTQLVATALLWSLGGLLIKMVSWNPMAISGGRSLIAALIMLIILKKPRLNNKYIIYGALAYSCTVILFVLSNKLTTAANAILLQYTAPIYVAFMGKWFLKEKTSTIDWLTILAVFTGIILFFMDDLTTQNALGNVLALISGVSFGLMPLLLRKQKNETPMESVFWGNVLTALIGIPFMFGPLPDFQSFTGIVLLGVFQIGLSYILYSYAIKNVTALEAILITVIEPILNPFWVLIALHEKPGTMAIWGGAVVIISILARNIIILARK